MGWLPTERLEKIDGHLAVTDENPHDSGIGYMQFWVDEAPTQKRVEVMLMKN